MKVNDLGKNAIRRELVVFEAVTVDLCALSISIPWLENAKYLAYKRAPLSLLDSSMHESIVNTA
jgi:hypothetical protein